MFEQKPVSQIETLGPLGGLGAAPGLLAAYAKPTITTRTIATAPIIIHIFLLLLLRGGLTLEALTTF
jgi:hypothetical protein